MLSFPTELTSYKSTFMAGGTKLLSPVAQVAQKGLAKMQRENQSHELFIRRPNQSLEEAGQGCVRRGIILREDQS